MLNNWLYNADSSGLDPTWMLHSGFDIFCAAVAMKFYVGTSGWAYAWNEKKRLDWYVANSNLNAIELNASFYRYPLSKSVLNWAEKGKNLRWAIKANRLFTHTYKFNHVAQERWSKFQEIFSPLDQMIDFYLFQLPPSSTPYASPQIEQFVQATGLKSRFALEFRNQEWFSKEWVDWAKKLGITLVSVDALGLPRDIFNVGSVVYVRMHGKTAWYSHRYSRAELAEVAAKVLKTHPRKVYVFFNNDTAMLDNARLMQKLLYADLKKEKGMEVNV